MLQQHAMLFVATGLLQLAARRWHTVLFVATVLLQLAAGIPCCLLQQSCCNLHVAAGIGMPCCLLQQACCNLPLTCRAICCNRPVATCRWHAMLFVATVLLQLATGIPCRSLQQFTKKTAHRATESKIGLRTVTVRIRLYGCFIRVPVPYRLVLWPTI